MVDSSPRVSHIHLGIKGGAERFFVNLVRALAERGIAQQAFLFPDRVWKDQISDVCSIHEFGFSRSHIARFFINQRISRINKNFGANVMMSWMPQASRWLPDDPNILTLARLGDYPEKLDYFVNCDYLVCNTPDIAKSVAELGWLSERTRVISNFTDARIGPSVQRSQMSTSEDEFVILGMGRLVKRKGFDTLIDALGHTSERVILWLMGEGEEEAALRQMIEERGLEARVRFLGWTLDPSPYLAAADALCIPSRHEPLGNVVLEAWACKKPVVATMSEGPKWLIEDQKNGLLVPIDDTAALGHAIERLCREPELASYLVSNAQHKLNTSHSREAIADAYLDLFSSGQTR
ncbi:glycosyltransferase [Stappia stellulata]|uniref:glycosyltransferase n=1 Tax=Stappia stellulata TaxID=71235 RepID=UPI00048D7B40|nr:glycosyltransferase [Stappia stellulata]